jgi:hypothetical protein
VRLLDLHGRGLPDIIFHRAVTQDGKTTAVAGAYRNSGAGWVEEPGLSPPSPLASDDITSNPAQFADVSGSGFADMIYSYMIYSYKDRITNWTAICIVTLRLAGRRESGAMSQWTLRRCRPSFRQLAKQLTTGAHGRSQPIRSATWEFGS